MPRKKGSKTEKNIKRYDFGKKVERHACGKKDPRRCLCWICIRDVCKTCNQIF